MRVVRCRSHEGFSLENAVDMMGDLAIFEALLLDLAPNAFVLPVWKIGRHLWRAAL